MIGLSTFFWVTVGNTLIYYITNYHPEKSDLSKQTLDVSHRMNWSKIKMWVGLNDQFFAKIVPRKNFFSNTLPNVRNGKPSKLFPHVYKAESANGLIMNWSMC